MMKICRIILCVCWICGANFALAQQTAPDSSKMGAHPRLLLREGAEKEIIANVAKSTALRQVHEGILNECDLLLGQYPIERVKVGIRLLDKSREGLRRVFYLAYAWRTTGKKKYFKRCEEEMLAIAKFSDWNPSHFLDVAEMTTAMSIGYDWLYKDLSPVSRATIARAIIDKGITPSFDSANNKWLTDRSNWNQVCNTGMAYGAIAVYENQPAQSMQLISRALKSIRTPMSVYEFNGNYPEGYNYWGYGTTFNVLFIDAMDKLFGTDFGLNQMPGFLSTGAYYRSMVSPARHVFNYSDANNEMDGLQPALFWFAAKNNDPSLLWNERPMLINNGNVFRWNRFLPAFLLWARNVDIKDITPPTEKLWLGKGENPVAILNTSWKDANGIYVGFKGGSPSNGHGHMDAGSFVLDAQGVRWSMDLGMQGYESLESKGIRLWDGSQNGQRWQIMRYNNRFHSTLTVNDGLQNVKGRAEMISSAADSSFIRAVADLQPVYTELKTAKRGIAIVDQQYVMIRDEFETGDNPCTIRWSMVTPATVLNQSTNQMQLTNKGKLLSIYVHGAPEALTKTWRTDPVNSWDAVNPGSMVVGYEITLPPHTKKEITVFLLPGERQLAIKKSTLKPLDQW